jgi:uncharacterized protein (TIGR00251 family)
MTMSAAISVHVQPKARQNLVVGFVDGVLRVKLLAAPVEGKANEALVKLLAERLGVPKSNVLIRRGLTSRHKVLEIEGMEEEEAWRRLQDCPLPNLPSYSGEGTRTSVSGGD